MTATASGDLIEIDYRITAENPRAIADAIRVEQTIEFPFELAPEWIQQDVVGQVLNDDGSDITIGYDPGVAGGGLVQVLNLLWGNVSLFPGVRVRGLRIPDSILDEFRGPRFGIPGLRSLFGASDRPLVCTAVKPMGSSPQTLAAMARTIATAGFDIIKDDHGLADQPWATWRDRVTTIAQAVNEAASETGHPSAYMPSLNVPADSLRDAAFFAKEAGAGALLVLPGISGFDAMRSL
ncbi:MAG: RuBisCO large subunit C-terminal-like domain-containing protein, partial [Acidimicrobiales bacterium]|nr:RuBisCO large subunit C-terminal-like domain-containing protein [Acidimicrobiales bacterium]